METKDGELVRSKLDGKLYKVNRVNGEELILESENGLCQTWFGRWDLELFFEKAEAIYYKSEVSNFTLRTLSAFGLIRKEKYPLKGMGGTHE